MSYEHAVKKTQFYFNGAVYIYLNIYIYICISDIYISASFQIEWNLIVVNNFLDYMNQTESGFVFYEEIENCVTTIRLRIQLAREFL